MKLSNFAAVAGAMGLLAAATPATAAIYTFTYEGVVASGFDTGTFGIVGDLAGQRYTAVYTVDTATPGADLLFLDTGYSALIGSNGVSPVRAALTINAVTRHFGDYSGAIIEMDEAFTGYDSLLATANTRETICGAPAEDCVLWRRTLDHRTDSLLSDLIDGDVTTAPRTHVFGPNDTVDARFDDYQLIAPFRFESRASAVFAVEKVTVAAVPEPATWAMMLLGFAGLGGALRTRRRVGAALT